MSFYLILASLGDSRYLKSKNLFKYLEPLVAGTLLLGTAGFRRAVRTTEPGAYSGSRDWTVILNTVSTWQIRML